MAEEMKEMETSAPITMTFGDTFTSVTGEQGTIAQVQEPVEEVNIAIDDSILSEEEKKAVESFTSQINIQDTTAIMNYGTGAQKKMADFSQATLNHVRTKNLGEVGDLLSSVVSEVNDFDQATEQKGLFGKVKKVTNKVEVIKAKYDKVEVNINKICQELEGHQVTLLKDVATFDKMYELNTNTYKELTMYIMAGKKKLEEVRAGELAELRAKAAETGRTEDAQAAKDLADQCNRFEKKLYDLDLTRTISMQTAPQIRMLQNTDTQMAEKIQSVLVNTIPLWKNQMVISLGIAHSTAAIKAEAAVTNATNALLKKNAESLHMAATEAAKANERGIVDLETLKSTNATLIQTLNDVQRIQAEGRDKRAAAEVELRKMEQELKDKLLEMSKNE